MICLAKERSQQYPYIAFHVADALSWEFPSDHFDCIVSIATLHHVPLEEMLLKMKRVLRVNGVLLILDLYRESLRRIVHKPCCYPSQSDFEIPQHRSFQGAARSAGCVG